MLWLTFKVYTADFSSQQLVLKRKIQLRLASFVE